jgi:hypothetical protein
MAEVVWFSYWIAKQYLLSVTLARGYNWKWLGAKPILK